MTRSYLARALGCLPARAPRALLLLVLVLGLQSTVSALAQAPPDRPAPATPPPRPGSHGAPLVAPTPTVAPRLVGGQPPAQPSGAPPTVAAPGARPAGALGGVPHAHPTDAVGARAPAAGSGPSREVEEKRRRARELGEALKRGQRRGPPGAAPAAVQTAEERRQLIRELAQRDPAGALELAIDPADRARLPRNVQSLVEEWVRVDGELRVTHEDYPDGRGVYDVKLQTQGAERAIKLGRGLPRVKPGSRVQVSGIALAGESTVVSDSITPLAAPGTPSSTGLQRTAVILVKASDVPAAQLHPYADKASTASLVFSPTSGQSMRAFYDEASYGQATVVGASGPGTAADVYGPYTLPTNSCDLWTIWQAAAAAADGEVNFSAYDRVVLPYYTVGSCLYAGVAYIGPIQAGSYDGEPQQIGISLSVNAYSGDTTLNGKVGGVMLHEFGHSLGVWHAAALECGPTAIGGPSCTVGSTTLEYGDPADVMGNSAGYGDLSAVQKDALSWLGGGRVETVSTSGSYTIKPYESSTLETKTLRVPRTRDGAGNVTSYYYVEYRQPAGPWNVYAGLRPGYATGVLVHTQAPMNACSTTCKTTVVNTDDSLLIDTHPGSLTAYADFDDAPLQTGQTYSDSMAGVSIQVTGVGPAGATLAVTLSTPQLSVQALSQPEGAGMVTGLGTFTAGQTATLTANANPGYTFLYWRENGVQISTANPYSFAVAGDRMIEAIFGQTSRPPFNDSFANPFYLSVPGSTFGSSTGATVEPGEPTAFVCDAVYGTITVGRSLWFRLDPTSSYQLTASTAGSAFDTVLRLYRGNRIDALSPVACSDEFGGTSTSQLQYDVQAGQPYYLQLSGYAGFGGDYQLSLARSWPRTISGRLVSGDAAQTGIANVQLGGWCRGPSPAPCSWSQDAPTDASGNFTIRGDAGVYALVAPASSGFNSLVATRVDATSASPPPGQVVTAAATAVNLAGAVRRPDGSTIASVSVAFEVPVPGEPGTNASVDWAVTGPAGTYSTRLVPGTYEVSIYAPGFRGLRQSVTIAGAAATQDFTLESYPVAISGRLIDGAGAPLAGQYVSGWCRLGAPYGCGWSQEAPTDSNGNFTVRAERNLYDFVMMSWSGYTSPAGTRVDAQEVSSIGGVVVVANPATSAVSGVVRSSASGAPPIAGATVSYDVPVSGASDRVTVGWSSTGDQGGYALSLAPGAHNVWANAPGFRASSPVGLTVSGGTFTRDLTLVAPAVTIQGRLLNGTTPVAGIYPSVWCLAPNNAPCGYETTVSDAAGNYRIYGDVGRYDLWVANFGAGYNSLGSTLVDATAGGTFTRDLAVAPSSATVAGQVTDAATGQPVADATVSIEIPAQVTAGGIEWVAWTSTGLDGHFSLNIAPGTYRLRAYASTHRFADSVSIAATAGQTTTQGFSLTPWPVTLTGQVRTDGPTPARLGGQWLSGSCSIPSSGCGWVQDAPTAPDGSYTIRGDRGVFTLWVAPYAGYNSLIATRRDAAAGGAVPNVDLTVTAASSAVGGTVRGAELGPLAGAMVGLEIPIQGGAAGETTVMAFAFADGGGGYGQPIAPGPYILSASALGHRPQRLSATVPAAPLTQDFTLAALPVRIQGRLLNGTTPVVGVSISPLPASPSGPDGSFTAYGETGRYELFVTAFNGGAFNSLATVPVDATQPGTYGGRDIQVRPASATVSGTVTDAATGLGTASSWVVLNVASQLFSGPEWAVAGTNPDGNGAYSLPAAPGTYVSLRAGALPSTAYDLRYASIPAFAVPAGGATANLLLPTLTSAAEPCAMVACTIALTGEGYLAGAPVELRLISTSGPGPILIGSRTADAAGRITGSVSFAAPTPGSYQLRTDQTTATGSKSAQTHSTLSILPAPTVAASPNPVTAGAPLTATWSGIVGATGRDWLGLFRAGDPDTAAPAVWRYVNCAPTADATPRPAGSCDLPAPGVPGAYELRLFANNTNTRLAAPLPVTVAQTVALAASPNPVTAGTPLTATWSGVVGATGRDWLGLYRPGDPDTAAPAVWRYVNCAQAADATPRPAGSCALPAPGVPGAYELRLFANNSYAHLATPAPVTVTQTAALAASPNPVTAGTPLTASWSGVVGATGRDWLGLYRPGDPDTTPVAWRYVNCAQAADATPRPAGSCAFPAPGTPGAYELRLFANNGYARLATPVPVTVSSAATLAASPSPVGTGATLTTSWSGVVGATGRDWLGLYRAGDPDATPVAWRFVSCAAAADATPRPAGSCAFPAPGTAGAYELRLFANNTYLRLATAPVTVAEMPSATATATPTPTSTGTATATPSLTATPSGTPTPTPTATASPTATDTPVPTDTPTSTPTATTTPTATPTDSPTPTSTPTATSSPTATPTDSPTPTPTDSPTPTPTDSPTAVPTATPTDSPTAVPTATPTEPPTPGETAPTIFHLGKAGFSDVVPHQLVRTADDRLYTFAGSSNGWSLLRATWTTSPGLPTSGAAFDGEALLAADGAIISVAPAYDGLTTIHVLVYAEVGGTGTFALTDYPFDTVTNSFRPGKTVATDLGLVNAGDLYIGTSGITAMFDVAQHLHMAYWTADNHIVYRTFSYDVFADALTPQVEPIQVDQDGLANHPSLAISPLDGSVTLAWVSEASEPKSIQVRRLAGGTWGSVETVSTAPAFIDRNAGISVDQGPSLVIGPDGVRHLAYAEAYFSPVGDYGRVHYVRDSGAGWVDQLIPGTLTHDPALAVTASGQVYLLGHGHFANFDCQSPVQMCVKARNDDGTWAPSVLIANPPGSDSFDASVSVKWSVVGFNRPNTVEFLFYAALRSDYWSTDLYYGRLP